MIGCTCDTCRSSDPRDQRLRPSVHLSIENGPSVLVDTSTDLRQQALINGLTRVDAILFTHSHADHIMGLDEVRRFNVLARGAIPAYADRRTIDDLRRTFHYIFERPEERGGGIPQIDLRPIDGLFTLGSIDVQPVPLLHGARSILGFRFGSFAYLTDCNAIPDASMAMLGGLDVLVLDALRRKAHPTHFTLDEAVAMAARIGARQTYFTHMCHDLPHAETCAALPPGVTLSYDGLQFDVD